MEKQHPNASRKVARELEDIKELERCAEQCGVVGDITKLKICYLLRYHAELSVTDIAELVGASVSNVSHSLNKLRNADLVTSRRQSQQIFYSLKEGAFQNMLSIIGNINKVEEGK